MEDFLIPITVSEVMRWELFYLSIIKSLSEYLTISFTYVPIREDEHFLKGQFLHWHSEFDSLLISSRTWVQQ